jgi:hypothetical protein
MEKRKPLPGRGGAPTDPICPLCVKPMKLSHITPVIFSYEMDNQVFACVDCSTNLTRRAQRGPCLGRMD